MAEWHSCPKCGEEEILWGSLEIDSSLWRENKCPACGFEWREVYEFHHNETCDDNCDILDNAGNIVKNENVILYPTSGSALDN